MPQETAVNPSPPGDDRPEVVSLSPRLIRELKAHPVGYAVLGCFLVLCPLLVLLLFPQTPPASATVVGLAFGLYDAMPAVPQTFH